MGFVYAEIELRNAIDYANAKKHLIGEEEIKSITVNMLIDSGSYMLAINENIQEYLQIPVVGRKDFQMANGTWVSCNLVSPIDIKFKNRETTCRAVVLPGDSEPLMGSVPMEDLDVIILPKLQLLVVNPESPDMQTSRL